MRDGFTYASYRRLIQRLLNTHALRRLVDFHHATPSPPFFILRHDVDYSPAAALRLAQIEADAGWRATYFLLPNGPYYNLLDPEHAALPRRLVALGHEVGLHYDVRLFDAAPHGDWADLLDAQAHLLSLLAGQPVVSIAMHQPALNGADPFAKRSMYLNAYAPRFNGETTYISDSCRAWRDREWRLLSEGPLPARLQLCLHPLNWTESHETRAETFAHVRNEVVHSLDRVHADLMAKIAVHTGVREHEAGLCGEPATTP
jgi:hypothetical protein